MDTINKTARQHCNDRHASCSWEPHTPDTPHWTKCGGYIVLADEYNNVQNGMIYAIEIHGGIPSIYSYTRAGLRGIAAHRAYSVRSLQALLKDPGAWTGTPIAFDDVIKNAAELFPRATMPTRSRFCIEYGIKYDRYSDTMINCFNLLDD